jgi:hypothetical protein
VAAVAPAQHWKAKVAEPHSEKQADKAPISTHPAFPAIVALWFACLLGLGSLVLPIALLERLVAVTGIAALVPAAEPPLGFTARALIALAGALGGTAAGLLLARRVARSHEPRAGSGAPERIESRECRPIAAHAELGEEGFEWLDFISEHGLPVVDEPDRGSPRFFTPPLESHEDEEPGVAGASALAAGGWSKDGTGLEPDGFPDLPEDTEDRQAVEAASAMYETPVQRFSVADASRLGPAPRLPIDDSPLEELGLVQLAGRLGAAIERRRALRAARSAASAPSPLALEDFEAAEPEDAARAIASFFGSKESNPRAGTGNPAPKREDNPLPAMKNPFSRHEEFVHGGLPEVNGGAVEPVQTAPADSFVPAPERRSAEARTWDYGRSVARIAPSQESGIPADFAAPASPPRDRAGTERDLRAALAALQRISGAA